MTEKPNLDLREEAFKRNDTLGMQYLLNVLIDSNEFNIGVHNECINMVKGNRATLLFYNGKKIYLDLWDYGSPTFSRNVYQYNPDLIIKLQYRRRTEEEWDRVFKWKKFLPDMTKDERSKFVSKIVPWTFFPSRIMIPYALGKTKLPENIEESQSMFFCGKKWKCRTKYYENFRNQGVEIHNSDQGLRQGRVLSDEDYIRKMLCCKFGLVLSGRGSPFTDTKNRREIDYMIMKKPLLINYTPYYYNDFIDGVHYIKINEKTDLNSLENKYNIKEIAKNGHQWYIDNASPNGIVNSFKKIVKERL